MLPFQRALVSSYRPSIVTFPLSLRVSEIIMAAFVLQHATFSHPPLVSPKLPHVPLGGWPLGYESKGVWSVQLVSKISNLCCPDPPRSRTDRRQTCDRNAALCIKVHRAVKTGGRTFTMYTLNDADSPKDVTFGGFDDEE